MQQIKETNKWRLTPHQQCMQQIKETNMWRLTPHQLCMQQIKETNSDQNWFTKPPLMPFERYLKELKISQKYLEVFLNLGLQ
jgi:hypothetical protein